MALFDRPESDQSLKNLGTLLSRLDHTLDHGDDDDAPQSRSIYERQKIRAVSSPDDPPRTRDEKRKKR
jgi:hypothetical protein